MTDERTAGEAKRPSLRPGGAESLIGTVISGRYRIEKLLGEGGMGAVYRAEHTHMRKRLAIKVLHAEMSRLPEVVARFEREAMAAAHIEHPNVASATDFGKLEDGSFFLVLEYVEGHSLRDVIAQGPIEVGRALRILRQIAAGLQRAHALGIVHRDLKPENVMLIEKESEPDFVKVLDFGIAKVPVGELGESTDKPAGTALTQLGMVYGTPEYMAPEQALGQAVDPRADIYSLGVITYEMLAGVRPFEHTSKVTLLGMHVTAPVPPIAERAPGVVVPHEVEAIVRRMLEKEADRRYADARTLTDAIDGVWTGDYGAIPGPRASFSGVSPSLPGVAPTAIAPGSSMPAAPATVTGKPMRVPPVERVVAAVRDNPKPFAIGGVATVASVVLLALLARSGTSSHTKDRTGHPNVTSSDAGSVVEVTPPPTPEVGNQIALALQAVDRGDFGTGIAQLKALEKEYKGRPEIHRALEKAYTATRNPKEALEQTKLLLEADPKAANDLKLLENVRNAAVRDAPDPAFELLEKHMGTNGLDVLYDIAYGTSGAQYPAAAERARRVLQSAAVRRAATPGLAVALELRSAKGCDAIKVFPRARQFGDARAIDILNPLTDARPCGFANSKDCNACFRKDNLAQRTIDEIQKRIR